MSLVQLVAEECANHWQGRCRGAGPCHVLAGQRCAYFEEAVAPIVNSPDPEGEKGLRARQQRDLETYKETCK